MARAAPELLLHGTAIAAGERAALLRGPSGAGKSDLALRFLNLPRTAPALAGQTLELVADDQVLVSRRIDGHLQARPPETLAGLMEVRGLGILKWPYRAPLVVTMLVDLTGPEAIERLPDPWPWEALLDVRLPILRLAPFESSAALKLAVALLRQPWLTGGSPD